MGIGDWGLVTGKIWIGAAPNQILKEFVSQSPIPSPQSRSAQDSPTCSYVVGESWARPVEF
ncbi:MAG: hypothetical protein DSM106950_44675 [Stigonema ocellatum SAG 48.90 = DSM 106950]|nr:hypothetical protein [Stigonema ocellatum SAG 48.90 = DSM 106950]